MGFKELNIIFRPLEYLCLTKFILRRMFNSEIIIENRDVRKEDSNQFSLIRENQDEGHISKTKNGEN